MVPAAESPPALTPEGVEEGSSGQSDKRARRFHGSVSLEPVTAALDFSSIAEEILQHFTSRTDMRVNITVEISAETDNEMDETLQRIVKENSRMLNFSHADFEKY